MHIVLVIIVCCAQEESVKKGALRPIVVSAEDRMAGRKHTTKVSGLESFAIDADDFAKTLQRMFSTSTSVEPLPGKNETGSEISIQGYVLKELLGVLHDAFGIPAAYVEVHDRTK